MTDTQASHPGAGPSRRVRRAVAARELRGGFSIAELLATIAIIALLVSILLPALAGSKRAGQRVRMLANQREASRIVSVYASDYAGSFPSWGQPRTNLAPLRTDQDTLELFWWNQMDQWGLFLTTVGYDGWLSMGPDAGPGFYETEEACCGRVLSLQVLTGAAFAAPDRFASGGPDRSVSHHIVRRHDEVRYPALKGLLIGPVLPVPYDDQPVAVSFADGHSALHQFGALEAGVPGIVYGPMPVLTTIDGVRGIDYGTPR